MNQRVPPLAIAAAQYEAVKADLMAEHGLASDDPALLDTVDGCTDLGDLIAAMIRRARELEAHQDARKAMVKELRDRDARDHARIIRLRDQAAAAMDAVGMRRLERPDFTASVANRAASVIGIDMLDVASLPERFVTTKRVVNAAAIREAVKAGEIVEGVSMGNGHRSLTIR